MSTLEHRLGTHAVPSGRLRVMSQNLPSLVGFGVLAAAPILGVSAFTQSLLIEIMISAILAMSLNLLLGQTSLVSLGHAAFFAIGAYAAAICASSFSSDVIVALVGAVLIGVLLAIPIGWLSIRLSGFYFLMITFAFAQMVYVAAFRWSWLTGGSDGLTVQPFTLLGAPVLQARSELYACVLVAFALTFVALQRLCASSFGQVLAGIRENTKRMRALGYNVRAYKLAAFIIAAAFSAFAGVLYVAFSSFVSPENAYWTQSAAVLVMVLIGGAGTMIGPVIGAALILILQHWSSSHTEHWNTILGLLFITVIWVSPDGIVGVGRRIRNRIWGGEHAGA